MVNATVWPLFPAKETRFPLYRVGPRADPEKLAPHRDSIPVLPSPLRVAVPTTFPVFSNIVAGAQWGENMPLQSCGPGATILHPSDDELEWRAVK